MFGREIASDFLPGLDIVHDGGPDGNRRAFAQRKSVGHGRIRPDEAIVRQGHAACQDRTRGDLGSRADHAIMRNVDEVVEGAILADFRERWKGTARYHGP